MLNVGICICARVNSVRLPGKVLRKIGKYRGRDMRAIEILLQHVIEGGRYPVVLAIPTLPDDDKIVSVIESSNIPVEIYRGENDSPLQRMLAVAKNKGWDYVVRITADDIFIDRQLLRQQVDFAIKNELDYCWMGRCPEGMAGEVIRVSALERAAATAGTAVEFISYLFKREGFTSDEFYPNEAFQHNFRLTLDYPEDLQLIKIVYNSIYSKSSLRIIDFLEGNRYLLSINKMPRVTVYITNYNYSDHVIMAIESVLAQTFADWELHIWDDCSTDDSVQKIAIYMTGLSGDIRKKVKLFVNAENIGLPSTCNRALQEARGRYIMRVDADDVLLPTALEEMAGYLDTHNGMGAVFSDFKIMDDAGNMTAESAKASGQYKRHPGCSMLIRPLVNEIKYRDGMKYFEGDEFLTRYEKLYKCGEINKPLWCYRRL
jgi:spore coat polysaccharide biosynthesis protein SpsF (cytidylyltransferase family)